MRILLHLLQGIVGNSLHASLVFLNGITLLNEVYIVEAEVLNAQFVHNLEAGIHLVLGTLNGISSLVPLVAAGLTAKGVCAGLSQRMPPGHGELQPVFHLLAHHYTLRLIIVESHHVLTLFSLERNLACKGEILFSHSFVCYD